MGSVHVTQIRGHYYPGSRVKHIDQKSLGLSHSPGRHFDIGPTAIRAAFHSC